MLVSQLSNGHTQVADYRVDASHATPQKILFTLSASISDGTAALALSLSHDHRHAAFIQSSYAAAPEVHAGTLGSTEPAAVTRLNARLKPSWGKAVSVEWDNQGFHNQGWLLYRPTTTRTRPTRW